MKFSLINVAVSSSSLVNDYLLQEHVGTLASAREVARATEAVDSHKITVAVVAAVSSPCAILSYWSNQTRLAIEH